ncbi:hypothetical protein BAT_1615 [Bacillus pumilus ATCC 7061]|nr:hypothetical protein BAT_1615 [Bacillus pumilus ATCC 7061]
MYHPASLTKISRLRIFDLSLLLLFCSIQRSILRNEKYPFDQFHASSSLAQVI